MMSAWADHRHRPRGRYFVPIGSTYPPLFGRPKYSRYFELFGPFLGEMGGGKGREREREGRGEEREGGRKKEDFIPLCVC